MKVVLFDFDFTLGDSSRAILECYAYAVRSCGLPVPDDRTILATVGMSLPDSFAILASDGDFGALRTKFREKGDEVMVAWSTVYHSVREVISALRAKGVKTGIVTSKFRYRTEAIIARAGVSDLFDVIVGSEDMPNHKPNPDGIQLAMRKLGAAAEETTYVGDAVVDLKTAQAAGVRFIGVSTGPTPASALAEYGVPVVAGLKDLLDLLEGKCDG